MLQLDIYSDVVCPWCYVGKRRLERALGALSSDRAVRVVWHPFQLNPDMPPSGLDRRAYRAAKFGSWEHSLALDAQVVAVGAREGIPFDHDRIGRTPNTLDAHRLIWLAGRAGRQDAVVEALFRGYFVEGLDVGDRRTLVGIAATAGLTADEVARSLDGDEGLVAVRDEEATARALGVTAVPFFVVDGAAGIAGAQPPATFLAAFEWARRRGDDAEPAVATAATCAVGGPGRC